jgi:hypothetical protein
MAKIYNKRCRGFFLAQVAKWRVENSPSWGADGLAEPRG